MISMTFPPALQPSQVTLLGYGALLSESSSRLTFPHLTNFRHVRVKGMRRVFGHPHLFVIREGLADPLQTLKLASLSAEPASSDISFVVAAFDVTLDDAQRINFLQRELEYKIVTTPYYALLEDNAAGEGVICVASRDIDLAVDLEVPSSIQKVAGGVWHWPRNSGLLPANVYLRHCLLATRKVGGVAYDSFLQDTYLADRTTTLAAYLEEHGEEVMASLPPSHLATRYGG
jgi:hypothetical protein